MPRVIGVVLILGLNGCTFSLEWFRYLQAQQAVIKQDYAAALPIFREIVLSQRNSERALDSARQGARVAHFEAKDYALAVEFNKYLVLRSPDPEERKSAQRYIAQIYFENLLDFNQAVFEYEKILKLENGREEEFRYRLNLAKSHFQMNNLSQTVHELDVLLQKKPSQDQIFEIKTLKANVLVANKQIAEAAEVWHSILKEFPERAAKENVALNLVVCYEDLKDFGRAIEVLEGMREGYPNPKFLESRIERLRERKANLPGAQGLKR